MKFWRRNERRKERIENEWVCERVCESLSECEREKEERGKDLTRLCLLFGLKWTSYWIMPEFLVQSFVSLFLFLVVIFLSFAFAFDFVIHYVSTLTLPLSLPFTHWHTHTHTHPYAGTHPDARTHTHISPYPPSFNPFKFSFDQVVWFTIFQIQTKFFSSLLLGGGNKLE